jgi:hypothetical protein
MGAHELAICKGRVSSSTLWQLRALAGIEERDNFNVPILHLGTLDLILQMPEQTTGFVHEADKNITNHAGAIIVNPTIKLNHRNEVAE